MCEKEFEPKIHRMLSELYNNETRKHLTNEYVKYVNTYI